MAVRPIGRIKRRQIKPTDRLDQSQTPSLPGRPSPPLRGELSLGRRQSDRRLLHRFQNKRGRCSKRGGLLHLGADNTVAATDGRILGRDACPPRTAGYSGTSDRDDQRDRRDQGVWHNRASRCHRSNV